MSGGGPLNLLRVHFTINVLRVLSVNSPTGCSAENQPVTWDGLRAQRGTPFTATRDRANFETCS
jgi:hypothetical protein